MMSDATNAALTSMLELESQIEARLLDNPDYRALMALRKAIVEVRGPVHQKTTVERPKVFYGGGEAIPIRPQAPHRAPSQTEAAFQALCDKNMPLGTHELLEEARKLGASVGGKDPITNLSSSLSRDTRLHSIKWGDKRVWWFRDREPPPLEQSQDLDTETAGSP